MKAALAIVVPMFALLAACSPSLTAQSVAPPGRAARLDAVSGFWGVKSYRLELSEGVAFALTCHKGGPCEHLVATSDDPKIAQVRTAALQRLDPAGFSDSQAAAAAVVIIGKTPGTTTIRVRSKDGGRDVRVTVVPPPPIGTPATLATTPSAPSAP
ncbi:MAG: hypothetical protein WKG01_40225 [Kofleriaceae bacterium]